jgi:hypothetical protein
VIRGEDGSWNQERGPSASPLTQGKLEHIASAASELQSRDNVQITRQSILLIDDDINNINNARQHGIKAVYCDVSWPNRMVLGIIDYQEGRVNDLDGSTDLSVLAPFLSARAVLRLSTAILFLAIICYGIARMFYG